jgi:excisionase family DNA binding protein
MMMTNKPKSQQRQINELLAMVALLSSRDTMHEQMIAELRAVTGLAPAPPTIAEGEMHIKEMAAQLGLSISGVHYKIRKGELRSRKIGGKVLVQKSTVLTSSGAG